jgi:ABC-type sugar transport system substrate-binding protein
LSLLLLSSSSSAAAAAAAATAAAVTATAAAESFIKIHLVKTIAHRYCNYLIFFFCENKSLSSHLAQCIC